MPQTVTSEALEGLIERARLMTPEDARRVAAAAFQSPELGGITETIMGALVASTGESVGVEWLQAYTAVIDAVAEATHQVPPQEYEAPTWETARSALGLSGACLTIMAVPDAIDPMSAWILMGPYHELMRPANYVSLLDQMPVAPWLDS